MKYLYLILGWAFGLFFFLTGALTIATPPVISFSGLLLLAIGLLIFPPFRKFLATRTGIVLSTKVTTVAVVVLFLGFTFISDTEREKASQQRAQEQALAQKKALEEKREAIVAEFNNNKEKILAEVQALYDKGEFKQALKTSQKYLIASDAQLNEIHQLAKAEAQRIENQRRTEVILEQLNGIPVEKYEENLKLYRQLVSMHPENEKYQTKVEFYSNKLAEQERIAREAKERKENIRSQFSAWDGSHRNLERLIKQGMHNPDSYEHVETTYGDRGNHLVVRTVFRGTNAFGGVVRDSVTAKVSLEGQILEIIE